MEKPAPTQLDIHPLLKKRWSPRSFTSQKVENESLARIFEAARWAPSSFNDQPWRFIVGRKGDETWDKILETLTEFNQQWAKLAPVLVISVGKKISAKTGKPNRVFQYDVGQSAAYITFQVMQEGLFIHQMGGLDRDKAAKIFHVPDDSQVLTAMAIGHKGEPDLLDGDFVEMEKSDRDRLPASEIVYEGQFGQSADFSSKR